jgi:hypothetical protein
MVLFQLMMGKNTIQCTRTPHRAGPIGS